jgi:hypothetical protein
MERPMAGWRDFIWRFERIETPQMKVFSGHVAFANGAEMEAKLEIRYEPRTLPTHRKALPAPSDRKRRGVR